MRNHQIVINVRSINTSEKNSENISANIVKNAIWDTRCFGTSITSFLSSCILK